MQHHSHLTTAPASATRRIIAAVAALAGLAAILFLPHPPVARSAEANAAVVATATTNLGRILVDARGRTLYLFEKDRNGKTACSGRCATFWPPLITQARPRAAGGAKASLIGTIRRTDGRLQVTYTHHPLYLFVKDTRKGQTNGEGVNAFGAEWYVLSTNGSKIEKASSGYSRP